VAFAKREKARTQEMKASGDRPSARVRENEGALRQSAFDEKEMQNFTPASEGFPTAQVMKKKKTEIGGVGQPPYHVL